MRICQILFTLSFLLMPKAWAEDKALLPENLNLGLPGIQYAQADKVPDAVKTPGFSEQNLEPEPDLEKLFAKRNSMLKIHKHLGYFTFALMTAALLTPESNVNVHKVLGLTTAAAYGTTAYFSIFAPTPPGFEASGARVWHKRLAWVHGVGMLLTPVLGIVRYSQKENGKPISGVGKLHPVAAITTYLAFTAALTIMTF